MTRCSVHFFLRARLFTPRFVRSITRKSDAPTLLPSKFTRFGEYIRTLYAPVIVLWTETIRAIQCNVCYSFNSLIGSRCTWIHLYVSISIIEGRGLSVSFLSNISAYCEYSFFWRTESSPNSISASTLIAYSAISLLFYLRRFFFRVPFVSVTRCQKHAGMKFLPNSSVPSNIRFNFISRIHVWFFLFIYFLNFDCQNWE